MLPFDDKKEEVVVELVNPKVIFLTTWLETKVERGSQKYWEKYHRCNAWEHQWLAGKQAFDNISKAWSY